MLNGGPRGLLLALRGWPARRWATAGVLAVPLTLLYLWDGSAIGIWWSVPAAVLLGGVASLVLAAYVPLPGSGRILDAGCTPCSAVAGAAVVGSFLFRDTAPFDPGLNLVSGMVLVFGLVQRLSGGTCGVAAAGAAGAGAQGVRGAQAVAGVQGVAAPTE